MSFFSELKRRNVFRVGAAYVVFSWLLIQIADTIFPLFNFDETPARLVVIVLTIGFFPAVICAWIFELTPEGLKKQEDVDRSVSTVLDTAKSVDKLIVLVLVLGLVYFAFDKFVLSQSRHASIAETARREGRTAALVESYGEKSIAVLAFADLSSTGDQEYFSDGISEELLNLLARIPELRVAARTSAFSYKGKDETVVQIGEALNVNYVLDGSVRKKGDQVRITAQLIDARSDTQVWSENYDLILDNIFTVQDTIAAAVVDKLKITLLGDLPTVKAIEPAAYELVLKGENHLQRVSKDSLRLAEESFERAIEIEPRYARAWSGLGLIYRNQAQYGYRDAKEGTAEARRAYERALALDPAYANAWASLGLIQLSYDWDFESADITLQRARNLAPDSMAVLNATARLDSALGRFEHAVSSRRRSVVLDPSNPLRHLMLAWTLLNSGRPVEAEASSRKMLDIDPQYPIGRCLLGQALLLQGRGDEALAQMQLEGEPEWRDFGVALALHTLNRRAEADAILAGYIEEYGTTWAYQIALTYAHYNQADAAFEWLEHAYTARDSGMIWMLGEPFLKSLHGDPRWGELLRKMSLVGAAQQRAGHTQ